jgi:hypothetical protein
VLQPEQASRGNPFQGGKMIKKKKASRVFNFFKQKLLICITSLPFTSISTGDILYDHDFYLQIID